MKKNSKKIRTSSGTNFAAFHIKHFFAEILYINSFQNINWLPANKKEWAANIKEKMSIVTVYIPSPYNAFFILEGQVHKDNKLGIMNNAGKSRLVKVIFTDIHKISDSCANSLFIIFYLQNCKVVTFEEN